MIKKYCCALMLAAFAPMTGAEPIALIYYDRPPYMIGAADGSVSGLIADPSIKAMQEAGLHWTWHKLGAKRIQEIIRENAAPACGIGWFISPEREQFAKFSKPVYRDKPEVGLTPKKLVLPADITIEKMLMASSARVLLKEGFTYGKLDILLKKSPAVQIRTSGDIAQMMQMIQANRADIMFVAEEEAAYMLDQGGFHAQDFNIVHFPDLPKGNLRHFMCSKNVPDSVIQKLNAVIRFTPN